MQNGKAIHFNVSGKVREDVDSAEAVAVWPGAWAFSSPWSVAMSIFEVHSIVERHLLSTMKVRIRG